MEFAAPDGVGLTRPPPPRWTPRLRWLGAAGIAACFAAVAIVLPAINSAVPDSQPIEPGTVFTISGFEFEPTPGWSIDVGKSVVIGIAQRIELSKNAVGLRVTTEAEATDARSAIERVAQRIDQEEPLAAVAEARSISTVSGLDGAQRLFGTSNADVLITAVEHPASQFALIMVAAGPPGSLSGDIDLEISAMVDSVAVAAVGGS